VEQSTHLVLRGRQVLTAPSELGLLRRRARRVAAAGVSRRGGQRSSRRQGFRAKDGSFNGSGDTVTFPDGRRVFTAMEGLKAQP
jgi:hypothetical protein